MGSLRSKEDEVQKISTSVFVTNFPDQFTAKELWNTCKQYGYVVDVFIPNRRSKAGKKFGFVRFIKTFDVDRLINSLCTVWVGRHKIHANLARFQRAPLNKSYNQSNSGVNRNNVGVAFKHKEFDKSSNSYAHAVKGSQPQKLDLGNNPTLVLDDSCLNKQDYSCCLMGKVKDFASLSNLKVVLVNEGFINIELRYMGGYWVMIKFQSQYVKKTFQSNVSIGTWFYQIHQATSDFTVDGRVAWVEIEGIPLKMWSENTFKRIASKWGTLIHVEDQEDGSFYTKRVCINTNITMNILDSFKITYRGKVFWVRAKEVPGWEPDFVDDNEDENTTDNESYEGEPNGEDLKNAADLEDDNDREAVPDTKFDEEPHNVNTEDASVGKKDARSEDPFHLYDLLNKKKKDNKNDSNLDDSLKFPPRFTPVNDDAGSVEHSNKRTSDCSHNTQVKDVVFGLAKSGLKESFKDDAAESICSGHFKKSDISRTGGSILHVMEELVKVGHTMGYNMEGLAQKAKKDWVKELCVINKVNFLSLRETKMENIDLFSIKRCWGNFAFDYVHSASVGNSGGILCVWDPKTFIKLNATISDYFVMVRGDWVINGEVVVMGDFNEVRKKEERFGSLFNVHGADVFNSFISNVGLEEVPLGGCSFTWCHKSATKMSKLDRFLISESLTNSCPNISAITLDRYLSDHRPILMRESHYDYGPVPFRFFHYWFEIKGFDKLVEDSWNEVAVVESNAMIKMMKKLKYLKEKIRLWNKCNMVSSINSKRTLKSDLADLNTIINKGDGDEEAVNKRTKAVNKRTKLAIRRILVDGIWMDSPGSVKSEFLSHFKKRFDSPQEARLQLDLNFPNMLNSDQIADLEREVSKEEIKRAVWDCGTDKSPGPDGFTFGFYRRYWKIIESDVVDAATYFFHHEFFPKGCNSSFIALIPKTPDANMVKDFRPISLIGSMYKIIAKILANRLVFVLGDLVNEVQSAFIADRQILDGPFILNEIVQWCKSKKKQSLVFKVDFEKAFDSVRGSVIVNGSPTEEFQFHKGLKQGDPLSPFLFILVMESLHISFQRVVDAGLFKGIILSPSLHLSHLLYADDAIFMGQWNEANFDTIVHVLDCFHRASGLRINMSKSKLMGIYVDDEKVVQAARKIGCVTLKTPFTYLGSKVGGLMSRLQPWNETVKGMTSRLSKWKMKTLSIGGRLTLLKSVLGSMPIYHMSLFKVPMKILQRMESIRSHFFNGSLDKKPTWVKWRNVLASKDKGVLGISSLFALNRALMFKWVWRFFSQKSSLWANVIKAIHGDHGKIGKKATTSIPSIWIDIVKEVDLLQRRGIHLLSFIHKKMGNGSETLFWEDAWGGNIAFKYLFPRAYALESCKNIDVASKLSHINLAYSFRRAPRGGVEKDQFDLLMAQVEDTILSNASDRWVWSLEGSGNFSVASVRKLIDKHTLLEVSSSTRWIKEVPIKVNVLAWKIK
ncbi:RNA-directed DNA polymerase, eukaryota [Tanacetum coccineum]